jgi:hypothetical protein
MNRYHLARFLGLGLAVLLTACGGDNVQIDTPRTAAMSLADVPATPSDEAAANPAAGAPAGIQVASASMPQPDCAADGCKGLRIVDANAEAFRYQAMQHADATQL